MTRHAHFNSALGASGTVPDAWRGFMAAASGLFPAGPAGAASAPGFPLVLDLLQTHGGLMLGEAALSHGGQAETATGPLQGWRLFLWAAQGGARMWLDPGSGGPGLALRPGDLIHATLPRRIRLRADADTRLCLLLLGPVSGDRRMAGLMRNAPSGRLRADRGPARLLCGLVQGLSGHLAGIGEAEARPLEIALREFALSALESGSVRLISGTGSRNGVLLRALGRAEALMADPALGLPGLARDLGLSPRYLQKLFRDGGESFPLLLRRMRLDRAHADLADPALAHLSVGETAFRCGFADPAYFSRCFRAAFGITPTERRASATLCASAADSMAAGRRHAAAPAGNT